MSALILNPLGLRHEKSIAIECGGSTAFIFNPSPMYLPTIHRQGSFLEGFGQGGVGVDGAGDVLSAGAELECNH